jgi:hypothetical protein
VHSTPCLCKTPYTVITISRLCSNGVWPSILSIHAELEGTPGGVHRLPTQPSNLCRAQRLKRIRLDRRPSICRCLGSSFCASITYFIENVYLVLKWAYFEILRVKAADSEAMVSRSVTRTDQLRPGSQGQRLLMAR